MRFREYLLALFLALLVVAFGLAMESVLARAAAVSDDMPGPAPMPPPASVTMQFAAPCAETAGVLDVQREHYGQTPAGTGVVDQDTSLLLLVAPSGSWAVVALTGAGELACGVASGGQWRRR